MSIVKGALSSFRSSASGYLGEDESPQASNLVAGEGTSVVTNPDGTTSVVLTATRLAQTLRIAAGTGVPGGDISLTPWNVIATGEGSFIPGGLGGVGVQPWTPGGYLVTFYVLSDTATAIAARINNSDTPTVLANSGAGTFAATGSFVWEFQAGDYVNLTSTVVGTLAHDAFITLVRVF